MTTDSSALRVRSLRKTYRDVVAVDGLDLDVHLGECFGLLGPNGAGKTTTIEICEGLTTPDSGDVWVLGRQWASDARALRQRLGIQLQETQLSDKLAVEETVTLFRSFYQQGPPVSEVIRLVQLDEKRAARVGRCRADRSSGSHWPAPWSAALNSSSLMNPPPAWIRRRAASCGT